ncbi:MAG TPA: hypothetical protein PKX12_12570 [Spirochaetota bacterium]|nr:hypothetical protein [Spirochaetota bacterium]
MALNYVIATRPLWSVFTDPVNSAAMGRNEKVKEYNPRRIESIIDFEMKYFL